MFDQKIPTFVEKAAVTEAKISHLNKAYSDVHEAPGHDKPVSPEDVQTAEKTYKHSWISFGVSFLTPASFQNSISLKRL